VDQEIEEEEIDDVGDATDGTELHQLESSVDESSQHERSLSLGARYSVALLIKRVDSRLVRALIIALGRSDNHALLATHARSLGVEYQGVEGYEVSELLHDPTRIKAWFARLPKDHTLLLAVIDSSIAPSTLRSFISALKSAGITGISVRTTPEMLEAITATNTEGSPRSDSDSLHLLSIARSPHNQVAIWPIITLTRRGTVVEVAGINSSQVLSGGGSEGEQEDDPRIDLAIDRALIEAGKCSLVGVINYVIDPDDGSLVRREFGASTFTFWSESASYTTVAEQMVRAILDLPLGDTRMIDFEEYFLQEELEIDSALVMDPTRPFLHLFARNPRLKVRYLTDLGSSDATTVWISISLFASSEEEALTEMAHAREFMMGK
jgi:hypothetical protein